MKNYIPLLIIAFFSQNLNAQKVNVNVNLNIKHKMGEVEEFNRKKFVNFHATIDEPEWTSENVVNDLYKDLLGDRNVHIGRNTGTVTWAIKNNITEDPTRPGFADIASIASHGEDRRIRYAQNTPAHAYEHLSEEILCTQIHPFYPDGKETNTGWSFSQTDTESEPFGTASGEFLGRYIQEYYGTGGTTGKTKPKFVEITNEPLWDLVTTADQPHDLTKIFRFHSTVAKEIHKYNPDILVGGYCAAFPDFDTDNFQRWHDRDKHFMDVAGEDVDFWTIHLYDHPVKGEFSRYRKGSNVEATMDMLEQYSWLLLGKTKPLMISEYAAQTHNYNNKAWSPYRDWLKMKSAMSLMMQFMERADKINYAMPFFMLKAEWDYDDTEGPTSVHTSRMMRRENEPTSYTGDFVYTEVIKLFDILKDINGTRVDTYTDNPDIMVDSYVDGAKVYVMVNNLDFVSHELNLNLKGVANEATDIEIRHLYLDGNNDSSSPVLNISNHTTFANDLEIAPEGTYVIVFSFPSEVIIDEQIEETKYYADTYLQEISTGGVLVFNIEDLAMAEFGEAMLRVGIGRDHGLSLSPTILVNSHPIAVPDNFRGDPQTDRNNFFGVLEIPLSYRLLQQDNEIRISFPDAGGYVSTVTMQVFNFSSDIQRREIEVPVLSIEGNRLEKENDFGIYPVPVDNKILIEGNVDSWELRSLSGELLDAGKSNQINVNGLNTGVYLIRLNQSVTKRFVKK